MQSRLFQAFTQADASTTRRYGGSGLGLHIVYNLVTRVLGGRIKASSEVGGGTRFEITLPLKAPAAGEDEA